MATTDRNDKVAKGSSLSKLVSLIKQALGGKQDTISDLATIRSGAEAGATALQTPIYFQTCSTAKATVAKVASGDTFPTVAYDDNGTTKYKPKHKTIIAVKYTITNTAKNCTYTLNVNSTGAYRIWFNTSILTVTTSANTSAAGTANRYVYYWFNDEFSDSDGAGCWVYMGSSTDLNTTYSAMTQAEITAGTGTTGRTLTPALLRDNFYTETEVDTALSGKQDKDFIITLTKSGNVISADKTYAEAEAAYESGKTLYAYYNDEIFNLFYVDPDVNGEGNDYFFESRPYDEPQVREQLQLTSTGWGYVRFALQDELSFDNTPTANSNNPVTSGGIKTALDGKQDKDLVVNVTSSNDTLSADKTFAEISAAYTSGKNIIVNYDDILYRPIALSNNFIEFSTTSCDGGDLLFGNLGVNSSNEWYDQSAYAQPELTFDTTPTASSNNPVTSGGIKTALDKVKSYHISLEYDEDNDEIVFASGNYNDVLQAYNDGKYIDIPYGEYVYHLISQVDGWFNFITYPYDEGGISLLALDTNGTWTITNHSVNEMLWMDSTPTASSTNPVTSGGVKTALDGKQATLVSGTNIKTINSSSILGSGNIDLASIKFYYNKAAMDADTSQLGGTFGFDNNEEIWYVYNTPNDMWTRIDEMLYDLPSTDATTLVTIMAEGSPTQSAINSLCDNLLWALQHRQTPRITFTSAGTTETYVVVDSDYTQSSISITFSNLYSQIVLKFSATLSNYNWTTTVNTKTFQETLESGTSIKTVNSTSLLGSGNVSLDADNLLMTTADPNGNWSVGDSIEDAVIANSNAIEALGTPNEIANISATESSVSGGTNTVSIEDTAGHVTSFNVKNGISAYQSYYNTTSDNPKMTEAEWVASLRGADGVSLGEISLVQTTGESEESVMSQKAVTLHTERLTSDDLSSIEKMSFKLPDGYLMCDYIQNGVDSSHIGSIKTGIVPTDTSWRFVIKMKVLSTPTNMTGMLFGLWNRYVNDSYLVGLYNSSTVIKFNQYKRAQKTISDKSIYDWHVYDWDTSVAKVDNSSVSFSTSEISYTNTQEMAVVTNQLSAVEYIKMYSNNVLVADMLPCVNPNGIAGLYDLVREEFYTTETEGAECIAVNIHQNPADRILNGEGLANIIVQEHGNAESKIMSQKAVTKYGERTTVKEATGFIEAQSTFPHDIYTPIEWCSNENGSAPIETDLTATGSTWRFEGSFAKMQATPATNYPSVLVQYDTSSTANYGFYLGLTNAVNNVYARYNHASNLSGYTLSNMGVGVWHTFELKSGLLIIDGIQVSLNAATTATAGTTHLKINGSTTKIRVGEIRMYKGNTLMGKFIPSRRLSDDVVGMYDMVSGNFYTSTSENALVGSNDTYNFDTRLVDNNVLQGLIAQQTGQSKGMLMSQKAITDELNYANYTFLRPSYFRGVLANFAFSDCPKLDIRSADGITLMFDNSMASDSNRAMYLEIYNSATYTTSTSTYFALAQDISHIKGGLLTNYYQTISNGTSYTRTNAQMSYAHMTITFNFINGNMCVYNNAVKIGDVTPVSYSEETMRTYLAGCNRMRFGNGVESKYTAACTTVAIFPHVLTASDISSLYGIGAASTKGNLIVDRWKANLLYPQRYEASSIGIYIYNSSATRTNTEDAAVLTAAKTTVQFGFTGISGVKNNIIYEWDMVIISGTWTQYSRGMIYNNNYYKVVNIYDSEGNDVSYDALTAGTYHVICKPDNITARNINAQSNILNYIISTTIDSVIQIKHLKVVERGAALICGIHNYKGDYFLQDNGEKVAKSTGSSYNTSACTPYYDTYKGDIRSYSASALPQFTGQMAVDIANNKVYVGYLTGAGTGTWKQINNS